jgi:hypothetical protein
MTSLAGFGALDSGSVKRIQQALLQLGYPLQGGADGVAGRSTKKAIELVEPKINAERKRVAVAASQSWQKLETKGEPSSELLTALFEDRAGKKSLAAPNKLFEATEADKKAVKDTWVALTGGGSVTTGGGTTTGGTTGQTPPADKGIMEKYADWLQDKPIPDFLKNPYVATGAVVVTAAVLVVGLRAAFKGGSSAPEAAVAGLGEWDMPMPKRKKRRKSRRKSKK